MRTKTELLAALEASRDDLVTGLDGLDLTTGVYEGGWNGHQLLAHLASMEWTYPRLLELPPANDEEAARPRDTSVTVDDYNQKQVEQRAGVRRRPSRPTTSATDLVGCGRGGGRCRGSSR